MTRVTLHVVTMAGAEYALFDGAFPTGELRAGEQPADAARRLVEAASGTTSPKLELVDLRSEGDELRLVFRAMLVDEPKGATRAKRMELPARVGALEGKYVEDALKTSLAYKLTRG